MSSPHPPAQQRRQQQTPPVRPPTLPARDVTPATIEDAYVRFIFYCNPALPPGSDSESLREAFRNPPRSGGKIFSPFTIFELVRQFYDKEIKTWTELTTRLGVEPPDPSKDESAQKIAQYGVRLKKWMNSMHVKAFFEYLMDISNDYWTKIPSDPNPIAQPVRDGVAVEDDMALRALLPHIRPKRGRRRPDSDDNAAAPPPAQRQRLSPSSAIEGPPVPWPALPDARAAPLPVHMDPSRPAAAAAAATAATVWGLHVNDSVQTPFSRWPSSAVTPTTRSSFWDDALEPRSAVTPSKPKLSNHRRGAKNVSSAWKPGGPDSGCKTRGRPPMNRTPVEAPNPPVTWALTPDSNPAEPGNMSREAMPPIKPDPSQPHLPGHVQVQVAVPGQVVEAVPPPPIPIPILPISISTSLPPAMAATASSAGTAGMAAGAPEGARAARPSISLQVPERQGGPVRLATPPPMAIPTDNNLQEGNEGGRQKSSQEPSQTNGWVPFTQPPAPYDTNGGAPPAGASDQGSSYVRDVPEYYFENMEDRSNVDGLISYFTHVLHNADWVDPDGNRQEPAGMEECVAMVNATLEHMYKSAESAQAFLINLAALCGAKMLLTKRPRCYRTEAGKGVYAYNFDWQYRFGHLEGQFTMTHSVPVRMWKKPSPGEAVKGESAGEGEGEGEGVAADEEEEEREEKAPRRHRPVEPLSEAQWQSKYRALMMEIEKRDRELFELQNKVMRSLKGTEGSD